MLITTSHTLQIIGRGNDQVAISSKFETREDIGMVPTGVVCVSPRRGGGSVTMNWVLDAVTSQSGFTQRLLLACATCRCGLVGACHKPLPSGNLYHRTHPCAGEVGREGSWWVVYWLIKLLAWK